MRDGLESYIETTERVEELEEEIEIVEEAVGS